VFAVVLLAARSGRYACSAHVTNGSCAKTRTITRSDLEQRVLAGLKDHTRGMTERMRELEAREDVLKGLLAEEPADIADIHPNVSGIYRKKVERLTEALNTPEDRNEAAEAILGAG
jgi:hypothetical protein